MDKCTAKELPNARYERKFIAENCDVEEVIGLVRMQVAGFTELYPARFVNNIYLDTSTLSTYFVHVNGNAGRYKVRIRWYGDLCGRIEHPQLEIKFKRGLVGGKLTHALPELTLEENNPGDNIAAYLAGLDPDAPYAVYTGRMGATLINRYKRHYYQSRDGKFRLTLDSDLEFYNPEGGCSSVYDLGNAWKRRVILELKYNTEYAAEAQAITGRLPFRVTRCSKYVTGIDLMR